MARSGESDGAATFDLPRGETYVPPPGLVGRARALPRGPTILGLALVAAAATAILVARGRIEFPGSDRLAVVTSRRRGREVRHERKGRGFWAGVLASAGSAIAATLARRLAEDVLETARENARRKRMEEEGSMEG